MSSFIHFIGIFKSFAAAMCPLSCMNAALNIMAYFRKEKSLESAIATNKIIKQGEIFILVFMGITPCYKI